MPTLPYSCHIICSARAPGSIVGVQEKLSVLGLRVTTPGYGYEQQLVFFGGLRFTDLVILTRDSDLGDQGIAAPLLYAILYNRPIILLDPRVISRAGGTMIGHFLADRLNKLNPGDLLALDDQDAAEFIKNSAAAKVDYGLAKGERVLMYARVKAYFRALLK
jgi:hypothetical protein